MMRNKSHRGKKKTTMRERRYFCLPAPRSSYKLEIQCKCWHLTLHIFCTTSWTAMFIYDLRDSVCFFASYDEFLVYESECTQLWESQRSWLQSPRLEILIIIKCLPQYEYILININYMIYTSCSFKYIAVYVVIMLWVYCLVYHLCLFSLSLIACRVRKVTSVTLSEEPCNKRFCGVNWCFLSHTYVESLRGCEVIKWYLKVSVELIVIY